MDAGVDRAAEMIAHLPARLMGLSPWQRRGLLFLAGALSVLSLAPFHLWPILWLTLPVLYLAAAFDSAPPPVTRRRFVWQNSTVGRAAEAGWWFGFGFHVVGLIWIAEAFLVEAEVFAWLIPVAVTGLPAGLALFFALVGAAVALVRRSSVITRVLVFALALAAAEWLRGHILTGLPWNIVGYALTAPDAFMQSAGLVGIYGLTLVAGIVFVWPLAEGFEPEGDGERHRARGMTIALVTSGVVLAGLYAHGRWQLSRGDVDAEQQQAPVMVRVVQPSVAQREKWRPENQRAIFDLHKSLSVRPLSSTSGTQQNEIEIVVWPEAAMPFFPLDQPVALKEIGELLDEKQVLITGALRRERAAKAGERDKVFNSLLMFSRGETATVLGTYDKIHLVPFGEYLPFQNLLERIGLEQLSRMRGGFASAPWPRPLLSVPGVGAAVPLICYEAIFPAAVFAGADRPRVLINVTNDGWFGDSIGPRQHFHQARVRATEEGLPMIRAANNGISAVFDGHGRIVGRLALNESGAFAVRLPKPSFATPYSKYGDKIFFAMFVLVSVLALQQRKRRGCLVRDE